MATLVADGGNVSSLLALPENRLLTGDSDGALLLWDLTAEAVVKTWASGQSNPYGLTTLPDGRVASSAHETIKVWDLETSACVTTLEGSYFGHVQALPDGRLATTRDDGSITLMDPRVAGGSPVTMAGHTQQSYALAVLPDGRLASSSYDHTVKLWDVGAAACTATLEHTGDVLSLSVLPDGQLASGANSDVYVWDVATATRKIQWRTHDPVNDLIAHPSGQVITCSEFCDIKAWGPADGLWTERFDCERATHLAVATDGRIVCGRNTWGRHTLELLKMGEGESGEEEDEE